MRHLAAYMLLQLGGNASPSANDITKLLSTVGIDADSDRLATMMASLEGKTIEELIKEGLGKLASVPSGGAAAGSSAGAAAGGAAKEEKKEEAKEEEKEESDDDMGFGLFD